MTLATHVLQGARAVRTATMIFALTIVVAVAAVQAFTEQYGTGTSMAVVDSTAAGDPLAIAVAAQEATGLRCSVKPVLTDVILFEDDGTDVVRVLTFDAAIAASAAREGWVRRYCI